TPYFYRVTQFVTELMAEPYPELVAARPAIDRAVREEEHRFSRILNVGQPKLEEIFERFAPEMPPMTEIVKAYDTYGVPRDLIRVVLGQHGVEMDEDEFNDKFNQALTDLQQQAQPVMSGVKARRTSEGYSRLAGRLPRTEFLGYQGTEGRGARVLALIAGEAERDKLNEGEPGEVLLDRTPFYAEAGGQIGDTGRLEREGVVVNVEDTYAPIPGYNIHKVTVERGTLRVGDLVDCRVDAERRRRIK